MWPIFIINLDRAESRMERSKAQMHGAGLDYQRVSACDWHCLSPADIDRYVSSRPPLFAKRPISPAEVACFVSHVNVWRIIASGDAAGAFIFEDDFEFNSSINSLLAAISSREPDWDVLKLFSDKVKDLREPMPLPGGYAVGTPKIIPMSTIAYAITSSAAAELAKITIPFRRPIDLFIKHWWEHGGCVKLVQPSPIVRRSDHNATGEIDLSRRTIPQRGPLSRFMKNVLYQLAFKMRLHLRQPPKGRRWPDAEHRSRTNIQPL